MTTQAPPNETAYERTAVIGRAMADPKRLCVLESLADGGVPLRSLTQNVLSSVQ